MDAKGVWHLKQQCKQPLLLLEASQTCQTNQCLT